MKINFIFVFVFVPFCLSIEWHQFKQEEQPFPRDATAASHGHGHEFFMFGGAIENLTSTTTYQFFDDLWQFDFSENLKHGQWTQLPQSDNRPSARGFHTAGTVKDAHGDKYLLIFGGGTFAPDGSANQATDTFWSYKISTGTWTNLTSLGGPSPRLGQTSAVDKSKFYVYGGLPADFVPVNEFWEFDINTHTWTLLVPSTSVAPHPGYFSAGDIIHLDQEVDGEEVREFIVTDGEFINPDFSFGFIIDTFGFNFNTHAWENLTNPDPTKRVQPPRSSVPLAKAGSNKKTVLLFGGDINGGTHPLDDAWRFHFRTTTWVNQTETGSVPPGTKHGAAVQVGEFFFVVGGFNLEDNVQIFQDALYGTVNL